MEPETSILPHPMGQFPGVQPEIVRTPNEIHDLIEGVSNLGLNENNAMLPEPSLLRLQRKSKSRSLTAEQRTQLQPLSLSSSKTESIRRTMKKSSSATSTVSPKHKKYSKTGTSSFEIVEDIEMTGKKVKIEKRGRNLATTLDASFCERLRSCDIVNNNYAILTEEEIALLGSQGIHGNKNYYFCHISTSPPMEYAIKFDRRLAAKSLNMDRVGYRTNEDGSNQFVLCDGTGGGGILSAVFAQLVVSSGLELLSKQRLDCRVEKRGEIERLLQECAYSASNYKIFKELDEKLCGSTTVCCVDCVPTVQANSSGKKVYQLNVASLGDCAVFHFDHKTQELTQQNTIKRKKNSYGVDDPSDSGGQILANGAIDRLADMSISQKEGVTEDDFVIGVTDGVLDNVHPKDLAAVLSFVITNPFFDRPFDGKTSLPWEKSSPFPSFSEFYDFLCTSMLPDDRFVKLRNAFFGTRSSVCIKNVEEFKIKFEGLKSAKQILAKELKSSKNGKEELDAINKEIKESKKFTKEFNKAQAESAYNSINKKIVDFNRKIDGHEKLRKLIIEHYQVAENDLRLMSKAWDDEKMPLTQKDVVNFLKSESFIKIDPFANELIEKFRSCDTPKSLRKAMNSVYKIQEVNQKYDLPWEKFVLPTAYELQQYVNECSKAMIEEKTKLSPAVISKRIMNYTRMITNTICKTQHDFYKLNADLQYKEMTVDERQELENTLKSLKETMRFQMDLIPAKADDCAIIVIRPGSR